MNRVYTHFVARVILLCCVSSLLVTQSVAENSKLDSLENVLSATGLSQKERINTLIKLSSIYNASDYYKANEYIKEAVKLAAKSKDEELIARASQVQGSIQSLKGDYKESIDNYFKALNIYEKQNNYINQATCLHSIGETYRAQADFPNAIKYLEKGLEIAKTHNVNDEVKFIHNRLSAVYFEMRELEKALKFAYVSIKLFPEFNDRDFLSNTYNIIGAIYKQNKNYDSAIYFLRKSLNLGLKAHDWMYLPGVYNNLSALFLEKRSFDSCIYYAKKGLYLSRKFKTLAYQEIALFQIYSAYKAKGNSDSALYYHVEYTGARWQLFNSNRSQLIAEVEAKYEFAKKEQENEKLIIENELQKNKISKQRVIILLIVFLVIGTLYIPVTLNRKRQQLKKANQLLIHQNEEIEKQSRQLADLNKTKDKILSIIAHDMINPFQSIIGFSKLLSDEVKESANKDAQLYAGYIAQGTQNLNLLLGNLLKWSQLQVGSLKLYKEEASLKTIIQEIQNLFDTAIKEKRINLMVDVNEDHKAYCDIHAVSTVIRNLVSNAIKFTRFDGTIQVSTILKEDELEFIIKDNGVGMDENNLAKLFSLDKTISFGTNYEKGSGFGLILCKEFVEKNGGKIWAESESNKGATIHFTLPRK